MPVLVAVLLMLAVGIVVGLKSGKLTLTELIVCGGFGLMLAATPPGAWLIGRINAASLALAPVVIGWFQ